MKKLVIVSLSAGILILGAIAVNANTFQGPPTGCTSPAQTGCNLDGVIWNRAITAPQAQSASFYITGNTRTGGTARIGNGLTIDSGGAGVGGDVNASGNVSAIDINASGFSRAGGGMIEMWSNGDLRLTSGKAIRIDQNGAASILNIANYGTGDFPVNVTIQGTLAVSKSDIPGWTGYAQVSAPRFCLNGNCIDSWPTTGGGGSVTSVGSGNGLTGGPITGSGTLNVGAGTGITVGADTVALNTTYTDDRYVNRTGDTMSGQLSLPNLVATNNVSSPIYYSGAWGATNHSRIMNDEFYQKSPNGVLQTAGHYIDHVAQTWDGTYRYNLSMRSSSNYNTIIGTVNLGAANKAGYFMRYIGASNVNTSLADTQGGNTYGIITSVPATNAWAGNFQGGSGQILLAGPTNVLETSGTARFNGNLCLGGVCHTSWPSSGAALPTGCASNQIAKWNGSAWVCSADATGGTITGVSVNSPLTGGGTSGSVILGLTGCSGSGQILTWNGAYWVCSADLGLRSISVGTGLNVANPSGPTPTLSISAGYQLPQSCSNGQVLKWNTGWGCGADSTGPITGLDIGSGISISSQNGPRPFISVNYTTLDSRYMRYDVDLATSGELNLRNGSSIGTALKVRGSEAIWFNGTYFSWGYGGSANYFANNVGIGNSAPATRLQVTGGSNVTVAGASTGFIVIGNTNSTNVVYDDNEIQARNNGAGSTLYIQHKGGDTWIGGALRYSSDARLKQDITPIYYGLNEVLKMQPMRYAWKNDAEQKKHIGFIAQDIQKIIPEIVTNNDENEMLGIAYTELIPVTIKAIQEQQEMIDSLKSQNDQLREQNQDLEQRLQRLEALMSTILQ